jgi:glycosyltransferase involved in cell wall biosynthesis
MPTYHRPISLKLAIQSILRQSFKSFHLYVVGDGCTDDTENVVKKLQSLSPGKITWFNLRRNHGGGHWRHLKGDSGAAARNYGFHISKEPYIAYLDDDDMYHTDHLELLHKTLTAGDYDFVYSKGVFIYPQRGSRELIIGSEPPRYQGLGTNAIMHTRTIANRVMFSIPSPQREHGMDKGLWKSSKATLAAHDWELIQRFLAAGGRWKFIPKITYEARWNWAQKDFARAVRTPRYEQTGSRHH